MTQVTAATATTRTGIAIIVAIIAGLVFYLLYQALFGFIVGLFARYDPSFGSGIGALILMVFGTNVLGAVSGAATAKALFPRASTAGVFYALSTFFVMISLVAIVREIFDPRASIIVIVIISAVMVATIISLRMFLRPGSATLLSDIEH